MLCAYGKKAYISAHDHGRMIDGSDIVGGEGPMAPTRCGSVPVVEILNCMRKTGAAWNAVKGWLSKQAASFSFLRPPMLGKSRPPVAAGAQEAKLVWDAFIYQIEKCIGSMAVA